MLSMFLIVIHHFSVHGNVETTQDNMVLLEVLSSGGKLGVNLFVLITGYFMISSTFKVKKLLWICVETVFYSIVIMLVFYITGIYDFNVSLTLVSIFPLIYNLYWFATVYVMLYIMIPYINLFINLINKKQHRNLIFILITLWSIVPTFTAGSVYFSYLGWFISLYIIASFIRLHDNGTFNKKKMIYVFISSYSLIILSIIVLNIIGETFPFVLDHTTYFSNINNLLILISTISLFQIFNYTNIPSNKIINKLAQSMFAVYLIHDNVFMREFLWQRVFVFDSSISQLGLLLYSFLSSLIVFMLCIIVSMLLSRSIKKIYHFILYLLEKNSEKLKYKKILTKVNVVIKKLIF